MDQNVLRSVGLLRAFVVLSAVVLAAGAAALGILFAHSIRTQAVQNARDSLSQYVDGVLAPQLEQNGQIAVNRDLRAQTVRELSNRPDILSVKVWRPDSVLAYTNLDPARIGKRFTTADDELEQALAGDSTATFANLNTEEASAEAALGVKHVLETYVPIRVAGMRKPIGAYEIYADAGRVVSSISARRKVMWAATTGVFLVLWLGLMLLVRSASSTLRRQYRLREERSAALEASYERLESSKLEAIESLNATVEAKDPYTAAPGRLSGGPGSRPPAGTSAGSPIP
jgi:hypothetical protein